MRRRTLLAAVAGTAGALGTAGCLQDTGPGSDDTTTDDTTSDDHTTTDDTTTDDPSEREWDPSGEPVETVAVGDRTGLSFPDNNQPHAVLLWNRAEREREVRVAYGDGRTEELERVGPFAVPADRVVQVDLQVPTHYTVSVSVDDETFGEFEIGRDWFDCNSSASRFGLGESELVDYGAMSTAAGCPSPEVTATDVAVDSRDCGTEDDEQVIAGYGNETVHAEGTFVAPTQCQTLAVAETSYDGKSNTARIVVAADPKDDGGCVDCIGAITYHATVDYQYDFPDHVEVVHRTGADDARVVATASWNADV